MHSSCRISIVTWIDKKLVNFIFTYASPISSINEIIIVSRRVNSESVELITSPVHMEYTKYMKRVDVADQLRKKNYITYNRTSGGIKCFSS